MALFIIKTEGVKRFDNNHSNQWKVAELTDKEKNEIQKLEEELGFVLVAYMGSVKAEMKNQL